MSGVGLRSGHPVGQVTRVGRFTYRVVIIDGMLEFGLDGHGWRVWGRDRAQRKATRELARYRREQQWGAASWRTS